MLSGPPFPSKQWLPLRGGQVLIMRKGRGVTLTSNSRAGLYQGHQNHWGSPGSWTPAAGPGCCTSPAGRGLPARTHECGVCTTQSRDQALSKYCSKKNKLASALIQCDLHLLSKAQQPSVKWGWEIIPTLRGGSQELTHLNTLYKLENTPQIQTKGSERYFHAMDSQAKDNSISIAWK